MRQNLIRSIVGTVFITSVALFPSDLLAKAKSLPPAANAPAAPATDKTTKFPFHGKLSAVDVAAKTFTLEGKTPRVFHVNAETKIVKNGKAATLGDAKVGEDVGGYTEKTPDGTLTALSVRFGPKPEKEGATAAPAATTATPPAEPVAATPKPKAKRGNKTDAATTAPPAAQ